MFESLSEQQVVGTSRLQKGLLLLLIAVTLFSLVRGGVYLLYPVSFAGLDLSETLLAFANGLRFDGAVIARLFAIPLLLMCLPFRVFDRGGWFKPFAWLLYLVTLGVVLLLVADLLYYDHVQRHLAYELLLLQDDLGFVVDFVRQGEWLPMAALLLFALLLFWGWLRVLAVPTCPGRWPLPKFLLLLLLLVVVGRGGVSGKVIEIVDAYGTGNTAYGNLSLNGAFTTLVFAMNLGEANHHFFPEEKAVEVLARHRQVVDPRYPLAVRLPAKPTGYNVVFVLQESWNFHHVDSFGGNGFGATPHFDALAAAGMRFPRFYAAGQRSIEGIQASLTGIPALKGLPRFDAGIGVSNVTRLGSMARDHGYRTLFVQSSARDSFKVQGIAEALGFDEFYGREDIPLRYDYPDPAAASFGWDYDSLQFLGDKLEGELRPFFAYLFTGTTHRPYALVDKRFELRPHDSGGENGYINTLAYADWSLGEFMARARQQPWFDNTVFVFTADHINHLQPGGVAEQFHIPLLLYGPTLLPAGENRKVGSQLDLMPTLIDLLGFGNEFSALGESLLQAGEGSAFATQGGSAITLINANAFLKHSLSNRLESGPLGEARVSPAELDAMEAYLLAQDQLSFELLRDNRWAR